MIKIGKILFEIFEKMLGGTYFLWVVYKPDCLLNDDIQS